MEVIIHKKNGYFFTHLTFKHFDLNMSRIEYVASK